MHEDVSTATPPEGAPGELDLVRQFVNTLDAEEAEDALATVDGLGAWLRGVGLPAGRLTASDLPRVHEVREAIRKLLLANNGEPLDPAALRDLDAAARRAPLHVSFDDDGRAQLEPAASGADAAIGALLGIVARAQAEGTWQRLKACLADPCQWAFYDRSRNRSRHWCSMSVCGNRAKVRSFRERSA